MNVQPYTHGVSYRVYGHPMPCKGETLQLEVCCKNTSPHIGSFAMCFLPCCRSSNLCYIIMSVPEPFTSISHPSPPLPPPKPPATAPYLEVVLGRIARQLDEQVACFGRIEHRLIELSNLVVPQQTLVSRQLDELLSEVRSTREAMADRTLPVTAATAPVAPSAYQRPTIGDAVYFSGPSHNPVFRCPVTNVDGTKTYGPEAHSKALAKFLAQQMVDAGAMTSYDKASYLEQSHTPTKQFVAVTAVNCCLFFLTIVVVAYIHVVRQQINGNQGSWTNTDDHAMIASNHVGNNWLAAAENAQHLLEKYGPAVEQAGKLLKQYATDYFTSHDATTTSSPVAEPANKVTHPKSILKPAPTNKEMHAYNGNPGRSGRRRSITDPRKRAATPSRKRARSAPRSQTKKRQTNKRKPRSSLRILNVSDGISAGTVIHHKKVVDRFPMRSEKIMDVQGSTTFKLVCSLVLNPGNTSLFPIFSSVARTYEMWQTGRLGIHLMFRSTAYAASGSNVSCGLIVMAFDPDVDDADPISLTEMENYENSKSGEIYTRLMTLSLKPFGATKRQYVHYSPNQPAPINNLGKFYDTGKILVAVAGNPSAATIGELYVNYSFDMFILKQPENFVPDLYAHIMEYPVGTASTANPFGTTGGVVGVFNTINVAPTTNAFYLPNVGDFLVMCVWVGSSIASAPAFTYGSNIATINAFQNYSTSFTQVYSSSVTMHNQYFRVSAAGTGSANKLTIGGLSSMTSAKCDIYVNSYSPLAGAPERNMIAPQRPKDLEQNIRVRELEEKLEFLMRRKVCCKMCDQPLKTGDVEYCNPCANLRATQAVERCSMCSRVLDLDEKSECITCMRLKHEAEMDENYGVQSHESTPESVRRKLDDLKLKLTSKLPHPPRIRSQINGNNGSYTNTDDHFPCVLSTVLRFMSVVDEVMCKYEDGTLHVIDHIELYRTHDMVEDFRDDFEHEDINDLCERWTAIINEWNIFLMYNVGAEDYLQYRQKDVWQMPLVHAQINGNNGSYTNTDDHARRVQFAANDAEASQPEPKPPPRRLTFAEALVEGEWLCPDGLCGLNNTGSKCFNCHEPRPIPVAPTKPKPPPRPERLATIERPLPDKICPTHRREYYSDIGCLLCIKKARVLELYENEKEDKELEAPAYPTKPEGYTKPSLSRTKDILKEVKVKRETRERQKDKTGRQQLKPRDVEKAHARAKSQASRAPPQKVTVVSESAKPVKQQPKESEVLEERLKVRDLYYKLGEHGPVYATTKPSIGNIVNIKNRDISVELIHVTIPVDMRRVSIRDKVICDGGAGAITILVPVGLIDNLTTFLMGLRTLDGEDGEKCFDMLRKYALRCCKQLQILPEVEANVLTYLPQYVWNMNLAKHARSSPHYNCGEATVGFGSDGEFSSKSSYVTQSDVRAILEPLVCPSYKELSPTHPDYDASKRDNTQPGLFRRIFSRARQPARWLKAYILSKKIELIEPDDFNASAACILSRTKRIRAHQMQNALRFGLLPKANVETRKRLEPNPKLDQVLCAVNHDVREHYKYDYPYTFEFGGQISGNNGSWTNEDDHDFRSFPFITHEMHGVRPPIKKGAWYNYPMEVSKATMRPSEPEKQFALFATHDYRPVCYANNIENEEATMMHRVVVETPIIDQTYVKRFVTFCKTNFRSFMNGRVKCITPVSSDEYIRRSNASTSVKQRVMRAFDQLELDGITPDTPISRRMAHAYTIRGMFLKGENLLYRTPLGLKPKTARPIMTAPPEFIAIVGPFIMSLQDHFKRVWTSSNWCCFSSGVSSREAASLINEMWTLLEDDVATFDSSVSRELCELEVWCAKQFGAPALVLQLMKANIDTHGFSFHGAKFFYPGGRKSGDPYTTLFNSMLNVFLHAFIIHDATGWTMQTIKDNVRMLVAGDDNVMAINHPPTIPFVTCMKKLGFNSEAIYRDSIHDIEFCSCRVYFDDDGPFFGPMPGKVLAKLGYINNPPSDVCPVSMLRGIAIGLKTLCYYLPPVRVVVDRILELTAGTRAYIGPETIPKNAQWHMDFASPSLSYAADTNIMLSLYLTYGWEPSVQREFTETISRLQLGAILQDPYFHMLCDIDTSGPRVQAA